MIRSNSQGFIKEIVKKFLKSVGVAEISIERYEKHPKEICF